MTLTVADNDRAGIAVAPSSLAVSEPAGTGTFRVTLTSEPSAGVTLSLAATSGECSVSPAAVSLDASNWRDGVQVTVTAVDDTVVDGATTCAVAAQPSASEAAEYRGLEAPGVAVAVADDDQAGVLVSSGSLTLLEVGETGTISVRLSSQPAAPVVVSIASDGQLLVSPPQVVFAPENWAQEQQFSVQVTDDTVAQGPRTAVLSLQLSSNDLTFTGLAPTNVAVAIEDNDAAGIMVSPPELDLVMGGPAGSYSLQLATQPASAVTVTLSYAAPLQPTPSILSFGAANWKEPRTVSVSVAPAAVQGDLVGTISHSVLSADPAYAQLRVADVTVRVAEGEAAAEADGKPAGAASAVGSAPTRFVLPQIRFSSGAMMGVLVVGLVTIAMGIEFLRTR